MHKYVTEDLFEAARGYIHLNQWIPSQRYLTYQSPGRLALLRLYAPPYTGNGQKGRKPDACVVFSSTTVY
jgi:hypothetical protein